MLGGMGRSVPSTILPERLWMPDARRWCGAGCCLVQPRRAFLLFFFPVDDFAQHNMAAGGGGHTLGLI